MDSLIDLKLKKIKLVITDVDGVLTDGGMYYNDKGECMKKFNTKDSMGMELLLKNNIKTILLTRENSEIVKLHFLDFFGYGLYYLNKIFFKGETYPTDLKIFIWDKIFTPLTTIMDFLTRYKFGKNILCIYKKTS